MIKWPFSGWHIPSTLQRRLFKFVLQRAIGQFLASEIDLNNLDVQLGSGSVTLRDLDLNVLVLNELLAGGDGSGSLPPSQINQHPAVPFEIIDGRLGSITVTIPWVDIWNGNCTLEIQDFVLTIVPLKDAPKKEQELSPRLRHKEILSSSIHLADKFIRTEGFHADDDSISSSESDKPDMTDSIVFTAPSSQDAPDGDASSMDGIQVLATLIDKIMSKIRITAKNTVVRIKHQVDVSLSHNAASPSPTPTNTTFTEIQIPYLSYVDETPASTMSSSVSGSVQDSLAFSTILPPIETIKLIRISSLNVRIHQWNQQTSPHKDTSASDSADLNDDDVYNLSKLPPPSTSSPIVLSVSESTENWIRIKFGNESKHASTSGTDDSDSDEEDIYDLKSDTIGKSSHYEVDFVINDMCGVVTPLEFKVLSELWEVINQSWPSPSGSSSPSKHPNPDSSTVGQTESQPSQLYDSDSDVSPSDKFFDMSSESTTTFATSRSVMFGQSSVYSYAPESSVSFHSTSGPPLENQHPNETEWTSLRLRFNLVNFSLFLFEDLTHNNPSPVSLQSHLASRSQFYRQFFLVTSAAHPNSPSQQQQPQPTQKLYEPFIPESSYLHHNHLRISIHNTVLKYISSSPQSSRPSPSVDASISKFRIHEYIHSHPSHLSSSTPTSQYAPILTFAPTILNSYNPSTLFPTFIPDTFESSSLLKRFHVELKSQNPVGEFVSSLKSFHPSGPLSPPEAGAFSGTGSILQPMGFINPTQSLHSPISPKMNLKSAFKGANDDIRISYSPSASRRLTSTQNETTVNDPPFVVTMLPVLLFMDLRLLDRLEKLVYPFPPSLSSLSLLKSRLEERELKFSRMWEEEGEADTDSERMEDSLLDDVEGDLLGTGTADGNRVDGEKGDTKWKVNCDLVRVWVGVPMVVDDDASYVLFYFYFEVLRLSLLV
ncbi:hypothetical protein BKA69DRAFT_665664 [Paraphysoderma sedebokerense]|nr:hypothetical protein BKA69DRAFT_665664 [Paraphysoderma sedebokerense]